MDHPANTHAPFPEAEAFAVEVGHLDGSVLDIEDPAFLDGLKDRSKGDLSLRFTQRSLVDCRPVTLFSLQTVGQLAEETGIDVHKLAVPRQLLRRLGGAGRLLRGRAGGQAGRGGRLMVVERHPHCKLITIHPETAETTPVLLKHVNRTRGGFAGVYAAVIREGPVQAGDEIAQVD